MERTKKLLMTNVSRHTASEPVLFEISTTEPSNQQHNHQHHNQQVYANDDSAAIVSPRGSLVGGAAARMLPSPRSGSHIVFGSTGQAAPSQSLIDSAALYRRASRQATLPAIHLDCAAAAAPSTPSPAADNAPPPHLETSFSSSASSSSSSSSSAAAASSSSSSSNVDTSQYLPFGDPEPEWLHEERQKQQQQQPPPPHHHPTPPSLLSSSASGLGSRPMNGASDGQRKHGARLQMRRSSAAASAPSTPSVFSDDSSTTSAAAKAAVTAAAAAAATAKALQEQDGYDEDEDDDHHFPFHHRHDDEDNRHYQYHDEHTDSEADTDEDTTTAAAHDDEDDALFLRGAAGASGGIAPPAPLHSHLSINSVNDYVPVSSAGTESAPSRGSSRRSSVDDAASSSSSTIVTPTTIVSIPANISSTTTIRRGQGISIPVVIHKTQPAAVPQSPTQSDTQQQQSVPDRLKQWLNRGISEGAIPLSRSLPVVQVLSPLSAALLSSDSASASASASASSSSVTSSTAESRARSPLSSPLRSSKLHSSSLSSQHLVSIEMDIARTAPSILDFDHEKYVDRVARACALSQLTLPYYGACADYQVSRISWWRTRSLIPPNSAMRRA